MAYDYHITKANNRFDEKNAPITLEELKQFVKNEHDFELQEESIMTSRTPRREKISIKASGTVLTFKMKGYIFWFTYNGSSLRGKATLDIKTFLYVAKKLGARVFGDNGEEYVENTVTGEINCIRAE